MTQLKMLYLSWLSQVWTNPQFSCRFSLSLSREPKLSAPSPIHILIAGPVYRTWSLCKFRVARPRLWSALCLALEPSLSGLDILTNSWCRHKFVRLQDVQV
ncbi:hypothetical protein R3P38DRAFT_3101183, partial [Favolaschia claudopus]